MARPLTAPTVAALLLTLATPANAQEPYDSLVPGHWTVISLNNLIDLDPCPTRDCSYSAVEGVWAVMNDWCGGVYASGYGTLGGIVAWGGGHNGYFGSEIYVFDLATQLWVRETDPYDNGGGSVAPDCNDDGIYPDGSACPTHTYNAFEYHPSTNRLVILMGTPDPVLGGAIDGRAHLFDFDTGQWSLGAATVGPIGYASPGAYDAARDIYWQMFGYSYNLASYDPDADQWTNYGSPEVWDIDGAGRIDPVRDIFIYTDPRRVDGLFAIDLSNPTAAAVELTTSGDTAIQTADKAGIDWDPNGQRFVAWDDGADLYILTPPAGDWRTETWVWTRLPPATGNTVVPTRNSNGTYGRFRYAASVDAFILVSNVDGPVWAYRLAPSACAVGTDCTTPAPCQTATGATCSGGICIYPAAGNGSACADDGNDCTDDICQAGDCTHPGRTGTACDDGDPCTAADTCDSAGACVPGTNNCSDGGSADGGGTGSDGGGTGSDGGVHSGDTVNGGDATGSAGATRVLSGGCGCRAGPDVAGAIGSLFLLLVFGPARRRRTKADSPRRLP